MGHIPGSSFNETTPDPNSSQNQQFSLVNKEHTTPPLKDEHEDSVYHNLLLLLQDASQNSHFNQYLPGRYVVNMNHGIPQTGASKHPEILDRVDRTVEDNHQQYADSRYIPAMMEGFHMADSGNDEDNFVGKRRLSVCVSSPRATQTSTV